MYNKSKQDKLFADISKGREDYMFKIEKSRVKEDCLVYERLRKGYAIDLEKRIVMMYLQRCKFKHSLAFMQFRGVLP